MIEPRACSFCDLDRATEELIPACKRPPTRKVRGVMFGRPVILDACEEHYKKSSEDAKPNNFSGPVIEGSVSVESDAARKIMMEYLKQEKVLELTCKGCGSIIVRYHENESKALGLAMEALGIDLLVIRDHLDRCDFRRTK